MGLENYLDFVELVKKNISLKKDLALTEQKAQDCLFEVKKLIAEGRFTTENPFEDFCICEHGIGYPEQLSRVTFLKSLLESYKGQYVQVHQTSISNLGKSNLIEKDSFVGVIGEPPLEVKRKWTKNYDSPLYDLKFNFVGRESIHYFHDSNLIYPSREPCFLSGNGFKKTEISSYYNFKMNKGGNYIFVGNGMLHLLFGFLKLPKPDLRNKPSLEELAKLIEERPDGISKPKLSLAVSK